MAQSQGMQCLRKTSTTQAARATEVCWVQCWALPSTLGDPRSQTNHVLNAHGDVIVANFNGEFVCKILDKPRRMLLSSNENHQPQAINDYDSFNVEGVVVRSIRCHRQSSLLTSKPETR